MKSAHLLAVFLVLLIVAGQLLIGRLKKAQEPRPRVRVYAFIMAAQWLATMWAAVVMGFPTLWRASVGAAGLHWLPGPRAIVIIVVISVCALAAPIVLARMPSKAAVVERAAARLSYLLPQNPQERMWWIALSLTAGICEECLFRSFLFSYLEGPPWHLSPATAIFAACLVFALGHLYQGALPAVATGVLGFLLFVFFLATRSLLLPIVMHALTDMRVLFLTAHLHRHDTPAN